MIWKKGHGPLPSNEHSSLKRLGNLVKKLRRDPNLMNEYDEIIQNQVAEGVVARVTSEPVRKEFYLLHKPVVKESAESTKIRIVFDASAKANDKCQSLNDCLETGPPLQNILWDMLVRNRLKSVALAGDLKKAFLQIRIRPELRDVLRFHWVKGGNIRDRGSQIYKSPVWVSAVTISAQSNAETTSRKSEGTISK